MAERRKGTEAPDLLAAAFEVIAEQGLAGLSLTAVADRAGVPAVEVYRELPGRVALLGALSRRVDEAMLSYDPADLAGLPPRDRVFELMMRRLDALTPYRAGLVRLGRDLRREPGLVLLGSCRFDRSLRWLQEAAGLPSHGLRARLRRGMLGAVYLATLRVWQGDESGDHARTMAELDKGLRRIEPVAGLREGRRREPPPAEEAPQPA